MGNRLQEGLAILASEGSACHAEASPVLCACEGGRDGRVVDGGGLENLIAHSSKFAISRLNSARQAIKRRHLPDEPVRRRASTVSSGAPRWFPLERLARVGDAFVDRLVGFRNLVTPPGRIRE